MKYLGSKARFAKYILPIILKNRGQNQAYVEPFVGGANLIDKVDGNRIGSDINYCLIDCFRKLQNGWIPPTTLSENEYNSIKSAIWLYDPALVAFAAFGCSFSGKWFGGYARGNTEKGVPRNFAQETHNHLMKQKERIVGVKFQHTNYLNLDIPPKSIIYCDPPYANTTSYMGVEFKTEEFWAWCDSKVNEGHYVYVSEYTAPASWESVWSLPVKLSVDHTNRTKINIEQLYHKHNAKSDSAS